MEIVDDTTIVPSDDAQPHSGSWILPIMNYIQNGEIPTGENPRAFRIKVSQFTIMNNILYKRSLAGPYLRCIEGLEIHEVLKDFHEGDCGNHTRGRALFSRILLTGYYWAKMKKDVVEYARKCDACQRHSNILHQPAEPLYPVVSSWLFMKWGMNIVGKLPKATGGKVFMLAVTDYFSKWIESEAFFQVREKGSYILH
ncbi:putative ribonuclease H superfamily, integrase zinc-binding domain-containing protein [Helianthus annuus]|nr:putative ribonuclease H superfamily, integrase zinc-binding domain-containing protein [Helianthus annuus]KAJ0541181.1 putative ribonuclease H superfamily, integrase zinc-binding domain-containing protein [Helianthus annuus]KAJ0706263.1 putative ribonuclease H superfamily, integrase zinc-binding domain-containing protein [Helianthus annuus]